MSVSYRISTITAIGSTGMKLNIGELHEKMNVPEEITNGSGVEMLHVTFVDSKGRKASKGLFPAYTISKRKRSNNNIGKTFDNQITCILLVPIRPEDHSSSKVRVNAKIFSNGNVQMTGLKNVEQGKIALEAISHYVEKTSNPETKGQKSSEGDGELESGGAAVIGIHMNVHDYKVCLINSDFKIGWDVRREMLFKVINDKYDMMCSFEPCIYPGVKLQYAWNQSSRDRKGTRLEGTCSCTKPCGGKKRGDGDGNCRRITIAIFRSGCVIVTGAHSYEQLDDAYNLVLRILRENRPFIENLPYHLAPKN